jgi:chaperone required for assembly of F1-ATPase
VSRSDEQAAGRPRKDGASLPKRFYKTATVASEPQQPVAADPASGSRRLPTAWRVLLDGKPIRTPAKCDFVLPTRQLAEAIAAEWQAQGEVVDPTLMPLTRLANSAIDGVAARKAAVCADVRNYLASDLLCYRAPEPGELVRRQAAAWDPILAWWQAAFGVRLAVTTGILPVAQPELANSALTDWLDALEPFQLAAVHAMTTLLGSAVLSLAHAHGRLDRAAAWAAAHIDEDFQSERWGVDPLAKARRDRHWQELEAASRLFELASGD